MAPLPTSTLSWLWLCRYLLFVLPFGLAQVMAVPDTRVAEMLQSLSHSELHHALSARMAEWDRYFATWVDQSPRGGEGDKRLIPGPQFPFSTPVPSCDGSMGRTPNCIASKATVNQYCGLVVNNLPTPDDSTGSMLGTFALILVETSGHLSALGCRPEALHVGAEAMARLSIAYGTADTSGYVVLVFLDKNEYPWLATRDHIAPSEIERRLDALQFDSKLYFRADTVWTLASMIMLETMSGMDISWVNVFLSGGPEWNSLECSTYTPPAWALVPATQTTIAFLAFRACGTLALLNYLPDLWIHRCVDLPLLYVDLPTSTDLWFYYARIYFLPLTTKPYDGLAAEIDGSDVVSTVFSHLLTPKHPPGLPDLWVTPLTLPSRHVRYDGLPPQPLLNLLGAAFSFLSLFDGFPGHALPELEPDLHKLWGYDIDKMVGLIHSIETQTPAPVDYRAENEAIMEKVIHEYVRHYASALNLSIAEILGYSRVFGRFVQPRILRFGKAVQTLQAISHVHTWWSEEWKSRNQLQTRDNTPEAIPSRKSNHMAPTHEPLPLYLITEFFVPPDAHRNWEIQSTLIENTRLPRINFVVVRTTSENERLALQEIMMKNLTAQEAMKVEILHDDGDPAGRLTFQRALQWCSDNNLPEAAVAVANSDIRFTEKATELLTHSPISSRLLRGDTAVSLSRWPFNQNNLVQEPMIGGYMGQDSWVFRFPLVPPISWEAQYTRCTESLKAWPSLKGKEDTFCSVIPPETCFTLVPSMPCSPVNFSFEIGRLFSDMRMNWVFWVMGMYPINPSVHVVTLHVHTTLERPPDYQSTTLGPPGLRSFVTFIEDLPVDPYVYSCSRLLLLPSYGHTNTSPRTTSVCFQEH